VDASTSSRQGTDRPTTSSTVRLDETQPITHLQIRLGDGSRCVVQFNQSHTISDVRGFINSSYPSDASRPYILMTTFPNRELKDESQSLADAGLLNAVITQRYV
jgi:UBX domain-containing protein 1